MGCMLVAGHTAPNTLLQCACTWVCMCMHVHVSYPVRVGLADEQVRWKESVERFDAQILALVGDVLLSAGCISYYGPFTGSYREVRGRPPIGALCGWVKPFSLPFPAVITVVTLPVPPPC
jgi:hypothetical protein